MYGILNFWCTARGEDAVVVYRKKITQGAAFNFVQQSTRQSNFVIVRGISAGCYAEAAAARASFDLPLNQGCCFRHPLLFSQPLDDINVSY